jgi:uncharacterized protein YkwD
MKPLSAEEKVQVVEFHNKIRAEVGMPPVEWDDDIAKFAQEWADHLAKTDKFEHRPRKGPFVQLYGENLAGNQSIIGACESWYSEKKDLTPQDWNSGNSWFKSGHYTQMIWHSSRKIGMGVAKGKRWTIYVCNYSPSGNMMGETPLGVKVRR